MLILKSLLSGGNAAQLTETNIKSHNRGGTRSENFIKKAESLNKDKSKKMEFMYCIPDLEVFIDKTIKKCLLEYDLDANDTEAVLDDMEKAWPKSPLRPTEQQVSNDSNDSSETSSERQVSATNHVQGAASLDTEFHMDTLKGGETLLPNKTMKDVDSRVLSEELLEERVDVLPNGKREFEHAFMESDRSDTSSPDVGEGKSQARKHPKLKSLLQQRYFEGQESYHKDQPRKTTDNKLDESWDENKLMSSNLDLLASAANIHTESSRATEEHRLQVVRRIQEESEKQFQDTVDATQFQNNRSFKPVSPETCQRASPGASFSVDPYLSASAKSQEKNVTSFLSREIIKQLFHHPQNNNHTTAPQENVAIRRDLSSSSDEGEMKLWKRQTSVLGNSSLSWNNDDDRATSSTQYKRIIPSSRYQQHNQIHYDSLHTNPDSFLEPFQYHGSRIANIIAEELQRDDDSEHEPRSRDNHLSVYRVNSAETPSAAMRLRSTSSPGPYKRVISSEPQHFRNHISSPHSHIEMYPKADKIEESAATAHHRTMPQLLPAHLVLTNTHTGSLTLTSHLGHSSPGRSSIISNSSGPDDEDQPQDLSTKSRRFMEDGIDRNSYNFSNLNSRFPAIVNESRSYISTSCSPLPAPERVHHIESPVLHKTPSPRQHQSRVCDYSSENETGNSAFKTSNHLERNGQFQGFDIYPIGAKDSQILANKRSLQSVMQDSETRNPEFTKKRKL